MNFKRSASAIAVACIVCISATSALAGKDEIKYRKDVYSAVGGHMRAMAGILKHGVGSQEALAMHAQGMADLAKIALHVFPENSSPMDGDTEAKSEIWEKPADFKKVQDNFVKYSEALAKAAASGDKGATGKALGALGKNACKACHDNFRQKK